MATPTNYSRTKIGQDLASLGKLNFLYDANSAVPNYANGASVGILQDLSGNGFTMIGSGATRPTITHNADGFGNATLNFNGSQYLATADTDDLDNRLIRGNTEGITFFVVGSHDGASAQGCFWSKVNFDAGSGNGPIVYAYRVDATSTYFGLKYANNGNSNAYIVRGSTNIHNTTAASIGTFLATPAITLRTNGVLQSNTVVASAGTGAFDGNAKSAYLGAFIVASTVTGINGTISMVGAYQGILGTWEMGRLAEILGERFQLSIN